ncbi:YjgN family protein [Sulfuriferula nivalis]|uniref:Membrane protein n=1 Tax=Sulfuriferula nivalis TaxID=2675298 RepID=A0A809SCX5_9PROT|nr:YjgN family protein [Sulfuriferula nivalis]BBP00177.1 membrane protein [Sulfuriferula nivalis]
MSNEKYDVLLEGVAEGRDAVQVKSAFAQLFKLDVDKVERIFQAKQVVLKAGVDLDTAVKYIARLASIGVIVSKREAKAASTIPVATQPPAMIFTSAGRKNEGVHRTPFKFTGKGFEYFKIWIVNILLNIVTLGIYSAWAKVRNKQYFYGNTLLDGVSFEYTASPLKILKGRIIAVVFYIAYSVAVKLSPVVAAIMGLSLFLLIPWVVVNSLRFNARHSSYRNINFRFAGSIGGAVKAFIGWPLLGLLSLGLLLPFSWKKQTSYITSNHLYGGSPFTFDVSVKAYYKLLLILIGGVLLFGGTVVIYFKMASGLIIGKPSPTIMIPAAIAYVAFYLSVGAYYMVSKTNIHYNNTQLAPHRFESNWKTGSYAMLLLTNTLGILLTLGLFIPFAKVRTAAYKAAHTTLVVTGDLAGFVAVEQEMSGSLGEGVHDIFDIDIGL